MVEQEKINVIILKMSDYATDQAKSYNDYVEDIHFTGTNSEQVAINAFKSGEVACIVAGLWGIDWERVLKEVGNDHLIVFSSIQDVDKEAKLIQSGVTFIPMGSVALPATQALFAAIREKAAKQ